jgi:hypothetical protein
MFPAAYYAHLRGNVALNGQRMAAAAALLEDGALRTIPGRLR